MPDTYIDQTDHYKLVARAIDFIRNHVRHQPSLADIAAAVNLSEYHLQRIFSEWAGISPKRFLQYLSKQHAKQALLNSMDVLSATLDTGLSSPGRLHDLMISCEAMTPGEIKKQGAGVSVTYGITDTPFGAALIGKTERGICYLGFCDQDCSHQKTLLKSQWPAAHFSRDDAMADQLSQLMFPSIPQPGKLHLLLRGTNFQIKVWEALLNIGPAQMITYRTLAAMTGSPKAHRSVGSAMAANTIGYLIPCHRVIRGNGDIGIYRWGTNRKLAMQAWESARRR